MVAFNTKMAAQNSCIMSAGKYCHHGDSHEVRNIEFKQIKILKNNQNYINLYVFLLSCCIFYNLQTGLMIPAVKKIFFGGYKVLSNPTKVWKVLQH
jgi:hypothetical protein